jgi:hypothetical protein
VAVSSPHGRERPIHVGKHTKYKEYRNAPSTQKAGHDNRSGSRRQLGSAPCGMLLVEFSFDGQRIFVDRH